MTWYVGQKIVCIDNEWYGPNKRLGFKRYRYDRVLVKETIYTIRKINIHTHFPDRLVILLSECVHPKRPETAGFPPEIFRPLLEKPTDISIFTEMLNSDYSKLEIVQ